MKNTNSKSKYCIVFKRNFYYGTYGANTEWQLKFPLGFSYGIEVEGLNKDGFTFETKELAQKYIKSINDGVYYLAHGEHSRPTYKVVSENHGTVNKCVKYAN